jgi:hypothetical protein
MIEPTVAIGCPADSGSQDEAVWGAVAVTINK